MDGQLKILNVGAHPADAFDRVGGTMAQHVRRGDEVCVAVLSHGVRSHAWKAFDERKATGETPEIAPLIDEKEREVIEGCRELGVTDVRFLKHEDEVILVREDMIGQIADVIRDFRPNIIITHHPREGHPAHAACAEMTLLALDVASGIRASDNGQSKGHKVAQVFFTSLSGRMNVLENDNPRWPSILVDIADVIDQKLKAMQKLKSQYYSGPLGKKVLDVYEGYYGLHARVPWVEPFVAYKLEVYKHLVVSDFNLELAKKSSAEAFEYSTRMIEA